MRKGSPTLHILYNNFTPGRSAVLLHSAMVQKERLHSAPCALMATLTLLLAEKVFVALLTSPAPPPPHDNLFQGFIGRHSSVHVGVQRLVPGRHHLEKGVRTGEILALMLKQPIQDTCRRI